MKTSAQHIYSFSLIALLLLWVNSHLEVDKSPKSTASKVQKIVLPDSIDFNLHVKPIISDRCFKCHGPDKSKVEAGLQLTNFEGATAVLKSGKRAIIPFKPNESELVKRILSNDPHEMMPTPKSNLSLTEPEKDILVKWIEQGAVYKPHWAFVKPVKTGGNSIDYFVLKRLEQETLQPQKEASKEILLRRLSLDLTGLPPTIGEMDAFLNDKSPNAYEKQVDRLFNSPHYGEKMAVDWLDLARFADSYGYTVDRLRDMSPYRDWVIRAFNQNMPYDTFIHQQLAGDLMPNPTRDMLIATAFNRNHPQNMEGGIVEQEFQTEYVMDRTNTFGDAFIGISIGCARCHDHKYDPISQKNYYELFGFFNNVREAGQISWNNDLPTPTLMLPTEEKEKIIAYLNMTILEQEKHVLETKNQATTDFEKWLNAGTYKNLSPTYPPSKGINDQYNLQGFYTFEDSLKNSLDTSKSGVMKRDAGALGDKPVFEKKDGGQALLLDGDVYLDLKDVGVFRKSEPFSVGIWAFIPQDFKEGVIFHKSEAERLYNFKGYNLSLKNNKFEITMAHTAPSNAITRISEQDVLREKWVQLTLTYDGSARAEGFKLHLDGAEMVMETVIDQLTKEIIFYRKTEPALQIGGWWRGLGFKGGKVDDIVVYNRVLTPFEIKTLSKKADWTPILNKNKNQLTADDKAVLKDFYLAAVDTNVLNSQKELQKRRTTLADSTENIDELMVMQEMPKPKKTHVLLRGQYDAPSEEVQPNTPSAILTFPPNLPKNRYGLAQWLTDKDNPLTARVAVNRFWQNFFGVGLVKTAEDFGNQGDMPSHLDLLDWLAVTFQESGWNIKKFNKTIAMSATYRQDSKASQNLRELDPENRLLARGASNRLSAEMVRDNALAASGLLNPKIGGKSIKPYQPDGLWEINSMTYTQDSSDALYRRSLYIVVKRSVPNPTLGTFDAPSRSFCVVRRQKTNTPLQALVTLNDPTFVETAKVLGENMVHETDIQKAITQTYRKLTGSTPSVKEVDLLVDLQKSMYQTFKNNPDKAKGWLKMGLYKIGENVDRALVAANAVVASTILNSDAAITKR